MVGLKIPNLSTEDNYAVINQVIHLMLSFTALPDHGFHRYRVGSDRLYSYLRVKVLLVTNSRRNWRKRCAINLR